MKVGFICIVIALVIMVAVGVFILVSMDNMNYRMSQNERNMASLSSVMTQMQQNMTEMQGQNRSVVSSVTVLQQQVQDLKNQPPQIAATQTDYVNYEAYRLANQDYCHILPVPAIPQNAVVCKPAWQGYYGANPPVINCPPPQPYYQPPPQPYIPPCPVPQQPIYQPKPNAHPFQYQGSMVYPNYWGPGQNKVEPYNSQNHEHWQQTPIRKFHATVH